jgi:hypothetical protein
MFHNIPARLTSFARIKQKRRHVHVPYLQDTAAFCNHPNIPDVCRRLFLSPVIKKLFVPTEFRGLHVYVTNIKERTCKYICNKGIIQRFVETFVKV